MNNKIDLELMKLTDEELLELFAMIENHIKYLDSSIIELEEETESEGSEDESN